MNAIGKTSSNTLKALFFLGSCFLPHCLSAQGEGVVDLIGESGMTALRSEAIRNWEKGRISDALVKLGVMAEEEPYEAQHRLALGLCLRRQKRYDKAMESYREAKNLGGPKGLIALLEAEIHAIANERDQVFSCLRRAARGGRNIIKDVQELPALSPYGSDTGFVQLALQLESFELSGARGRDPFSDPFPLLSPGKPAGPQEPAGADARGRDLEAEVVNRFRALASRVQSAYSAGDEAALLGAWAEIEKLGIDEESLVLGRHRREYRDIRSGLQSLDGKLDSILLRHHYQVAVSGLSEMQDDFDRAYYSQMERLSGAVLSNCRKLRELSADYAPVAVELVRRSRDLVRRTAVRLEFERRSPKLNGILVGEGPGLAVVDGRPLRPGERISDFQLLEVSSDRVKFAYKGEEIPVRLVGNRDNN